MSDPTREEAMDNVLKYNQRTPVSRSDAPPLCYGEPDQVCPKDERGIIQPQTECLTCGHLKGCLQRALCREGVIPAPISESPVVSRVSCFLKRWSDRKLSNTCPSDNAVPSSAQTSDARPDY